MEEVTHCAVHRRRPAEYVCPICKNFPLCDACKQEHVNDTRHAPENCKKVGLAIMHQHIQGAGARQAKKLAKGLRKLMKELEAGVLLEIDRLHLSCMQTEELRKMQKLNSEGRYAELYFYAKRLSTDGTKNQAEMGELNKRLAKMIDTASDGLEKMRNKIAVVAQYKPAFAAYKKEEVLMLKGQSYKEEEKVISALRSANMSTKFKAVYIDSFSFCAGDSVASELASYIQVHPVSALYLGGFYFSDAIAEVLVQAAFCNKSLSTFCMDYCINSDTRAKAVAEAARNCHSLTTFCLYDNGEISDSGAKGVAEAVKDCPLSVFHLDGMISDAGAIAVVKAVKSCPLSVLSLCNQSLSDAGAIAVAEAAKVFPLSAFFIAGESITNAGATAVAEILSSGCFSTLSTFFISGDGISESCAKNIVDASRNCPLLSEFYFDGILVAGETLAYILEGMANTSTIRSVNLCIDKISKEQMDSLLDRLQQNGVGRQLKLRFECTRDSARTVCEKSAAEWNRKLAEFKVVSSIFNLFKEEVILGVPK